MKALALLVLAVAASATAKDAGPLEQALAGRVAGAPSECAPIFANIPLEPVDASTLLYRPTARRTWVAKLPAPCPGLTRDAIVIVEPMSGASYCQGDRIRALDRVTRATRTTCRLGMFTPWDRRPAATPSPTPSPTRTPAGRAR